MTNTTINNADPVSILTTLVEVWCDQYGVTPSQITIYQAKGEQNAICRKSNKGTVTSIA